MGGDLSRLSFRGWNLFHSNNTVDVVVSLGAGGQEKKSTSGFY